MDDKVSAAVAVQVAEDLAAGRTMTSSLAGRTIVVTGAASGIGRVVALHLASLGCNLALTDLDVEGGRAVCREVQILMNGKHNIVFASLDVCDDDAVGKLVRTFGRTFKRLDGLVNCAGERYSYAFCCITLCKTDVSAFVRSLICSHAVIAGINRPSAATHEIASIEFFNTTVDINARGTVSFCQHFIKEIFNSPLSPSPPAGGYSIVNIGSTSSLRGQKSGAAYVCAEEYPLQLDS